MKIYFAYYYASNVFNQNNFLFHYIFCLLCDMMPRPEQKKKCLNFRDCTNDYAQQQRSNKAMREEERKKEIIEESF